MPAKIIHLGEFRTGFKAANGVRFPELFRLDGFYFDVVEGETVASERPAPSDYVLDAQDSHGLANPRWTPLKRLDPAIDTGWLLVRHHLRRAEFDGYFDALVDLDLVETAEAYETREGLFTLTRRPAPAGAPDSLVIYITKEHTHFGSVDGEWIDRCQIVHPDGTVTDDIDALTPSDDDDGAIA